ncbi:hypothetical protein ABWK96_004514 [Vibrio parahaemolyticus]|uniref:hypothetical protein n=1 Tax=Vibrio harveyi group TaxID=717610 RepID=UPI0003F9137F|nr:MULTISPECIES: hypothetical protein [Vibrio harveyi group]KIT56352.1 hypothetical protein H334_17800 [Vibrio parahaemolyticus 901128]EHK0049991.1 hypothetical protein [Vibrio parahaemolyticus]EHK2884521.1 hypothetical protein [Vibrio parahaemolyticus]EHZ2732310.1 hypothetical protein [Vibrio parahaemolyticus]EIA1349964.1 hypothetical protein [Vibrio parahaemolyticus]
MDKQSKHSRVIEHIELATAMIEFVAAVYENYPVLVELFNMAFNYPKRNDLYS